MTDPTAVIGRRIAAYLIDGIIVFGIFTAAFFALGSDGSDFDADAGRRAAETFGLGDLNEGFNARWDLGNQVGGYLNVDLDSADGGDVKVVEGTDFWIVTLVGLAASVGLLVLLQGTTGSTPGKAASGIRTVGADGRPPGIGKAFIRWLLLFVDSFFILPGLITSLVSKGHRRIGDMAASTYVVAASAAGRPVSIDAPMQAYAPAASGPPAVDAQWDAARNTWIRWDGTSWTGWDASTGTWRVL